MPPSFRSLCSGDPEPHACAERPEILERAAEARKYEAVDRGAEEGGRLCGDVRPVAVADEYDLVCFGGLSCICDEGVKDGDLDLELSVVIRVDPIPSVNYFHKDFCLRIGVDCETDLEDEPTPIRS